MHETKRNGGERLTSNPTEGYPTYIPGEGSMISSIKKWGNSQGLRLTRKILEEAQLDVGDQVDITVEDRRIILTPVAQVRGRIRLRDLVSRLSGPDRAEEVDWGAPEGREEW